MQSYIADIRFSWRIMKKNRFSSVIVLLTLALGIGVSTTVFSVVNSVLIRPLPYPRPDELVQVGKICRSGWESEPAFTTTLAVPEVLAWEESKGIFSSFAVYEGEGKNLIEGPEPQRVNCGKVSASFFSQFNVQMERGRGFWREDQQSGARAVAILSHSLWKTSFNARSNILGSSITLDQKSYSVIGVLAPDFQFCEPYDILIPSVLDRGEFAMPKVIVRLRPNVALEQAQTELDTVYQQVKDPKETGHVELVSLKDQNAAEVRSSLLLFLAATGLVMFIACGNVANMLLAITSGRAKELSIRVALGASRWRVLRQLMTENVMLALLGGMAGLLPVFWCGRLIRPFLDTLPTMSSYHVDGRVLAFAFCLAVLTGLLFGVVPAWQMSQIAPGQAMKEGTPIIMGAKMHHRVPLSRVLIVIETALALVLAGCALLLGNSFLRIQGVDLGIRLDKVLTLTIALSERAYPNARSQANYFEQVISKLRAIPGVEAVGLSSMLPLGDFGGASGGYEIEGRTVGAERTLGITFSSSVNADYFKVLEIPLKKGRWFNDQDRSAKKSVVIINESFAQQYFRGEEPLEQRISGMRIIGVVADTRVSALVERQPEIYFSFLEIGGTCMHLAIRTRGDPMKFASVIRSQIQNVDRSQPYFHIMTMEQRLAKFLAPRSVTLMSATALGIMALVLAALGLYGVLSFSVAKQRHDIGIMMALGAGRGDVFTQVIGSGLKLTLIGILLGFVAAYWLTDLLKTFLYGVKPLDPLTFVLCGCLLLVVALLASFVPARIAMKVNPMAALRSE